MPQGIAGWQPLADGLSDWKPRYLDTTLEVRQDFQHESGPVGLYLIFYDNTGGELVNSENVMVAQGDPVWRMPYRQSVPARLGGKDIAVNESQVQSSDQKLLVWNWYWIDGHHVANDYAAKLYEALAILLGRGHRQAGIAPLYTHGSEARTRPRTPATLCPGHAAGSGGELECHALNRLPSESRPSFCRPYLAITAGDWRDAVVA